MESVQWECLERLKTYWLSRHYLTLQPQRVLYVHRQLLLMICNQIIIIPGQGRGNGRSLSHVMLTHLSLKGCVAIITMATHFRATLRGN